MKAKGARELSATTVWGEGPSDIMAFSLYRDSAGKLLEASYIDLDLEEIDAFIVALLRARTDAQRLEQLYQRDAKLDLVESRLRAMNLRVIFSDDMWGIYTIEGILIKAFSTLSRMMSYLLDEPQPNGENC